MTYENIAKAVFADRPNRFIAHVDIGGKIETVHVKNTGRCRELLTPGADVWLSPANDPHRKTAYDLIAVRKAGGAIVNIDSQAPNKAVFEWLKGQKFDRLLPEYTYGESRIDFYAERGEDKYLMEVKGCTLERNGTGYFPDAPTLRGVKHVRELIRAQSEGFRAVLAFVIQLEGVTEVKANTGTDPEFGRALEEAGQAGVTVLPLPCRVGPGSISIISGKTLAEAVSGGSPDVPRQIQRGKKT